MKPETICRLLEVIQGLTVEERRELAREIATLHENAFRRGFQHGHLVGADSETTEEEVAEWRHEKRRGRADTPPGHSEVSEFMQRPFSRLEAEAVSSGVFVQMLLQELRRA